MPPLRSQAAPILRGIAMQPLPAIIGGLVGVIGVMVSQATRDKARERARLRGAAVTRGIESGAIAESIRGGIGGTGPARARDAPSRGACTVGLQAWACEQA